MHSSLERDVTTVAILSHLCGIVEGYVRNACSNNYTKYDIIMNRGIPFVPQ